MQLEHSERHAQQPAQPMQQPAQQSARRWFSLKKSLATRFLAALSKDYDVFAPLQGNGTTAFKPASLLADGYELDLESIPTHYSAKKFFLPTKEKLFEWERLPHKVEVKPSLPDVAELEAQPKKIVFGLRGCDVAAVDYMNRFFAEKYADPYYAANASKVARITVACEKEGRYCFCRTFGTWRPAGDADLVFARADRVNYAVKAATPFGEEIIAKTRGLLKPASRVQERRAEKTLREGPAEGGSRRLSSERIQEFLSLHEHEVLDSKAWLRAGGRCFTCAGCTLVCPTCSCFDVSEEPDLSLNSGVRYRAWDSCMLLDFTRVAGDYYFRKEIPARLRWRVLHKLRYPTERFGWNGCVGCGRCIKICPAGIDHRKVATEVLREQYKRAKSKASAETSARKQG